MHSFSPGNRETPHLRNCSFNVASISERSQAGTGSIPIKSLKKIMTAALRYRTAEMFAALP
jgi:hypothetical protein